MPQTETCPHTSPYIHCQLTEPIQIWSKGTSIVGTALEAKPHAVQVPLDLDGTIVKPGDLVFCDDINGVVVIPQEKIDEVLSLLPRMTAADQKVEADVAKGMTVKEAFKKHRPVSPKP